MLDNMNNDDDVEISDNINNDDDDVEMLDNINNDDDVEISDNINNDVMSKCQIISMVM